jgi:hypothetical protein
VVKAQSAAVAGRTDARESLRAASAELQSQLEAAVNETISVLASAGHPATEQSRRQVHDLLRQAAVSGGESWRQLDKGALLEPPPADEGLAGLAPLAAMEPAGGQRARAQAQRREQERAKVEAQAEAERARRAEVAAGRARREAEDLKAALKRAEERAQQAEEEAVRLRQKAEAAGRGLKRRK